MLTVSSRVLRLPEVMAKAGIRRDTVYRLARKGEFPNPVKLSDRASGWLESEIDAWIEKRVLATRAMKLAA